MMREPLSRQGSTKERRDPGTIGKMDDAKFANESTQRVTCAQVCGWVFIRKNTWSAGSMGTAKRRAAGGVCGCVYGIVQHSRYLTREKQKERQKHQENGSDLITCNERPIQPRESESVWSTVWESRATAGQRGTSVPSAAAAAVPGQRSLAPARKGRDVQRAQAAVHPPASLAAALAAAAGAAASCDRGTEARGAGHLTRGARASLRATATALGWFGRIGAASVACGVAERS